MTDLTTGSISASRREACVEHLLDRLGAGGVIP